MKVCPFEKLWSPGKPKQAVLPSSEIEKRIAVLDSIHDVLTGEAREAYLIGHHLRNSWSYDIPNKGKATFIEDLIKFRTMWSDSMQSIDKIVRKHSYYDEIEHWFRSSSNYQGKLTESINKFIASAEALPNGKIERKTALLLSDEGNSFSDAVTECSVWIEDMKSYLSDKRKKLLGDE